MSCDTAQERTEPPPPPAPRRLLSRLTLDTRPLRYPAYRRLWTSTLVTGVGSQLTAVAVPKQIYDITGSSAWIGIASIAGLAPLVVFGLWGGAVADAVDRRKLLIATNSGIAATSLALWAQSAAGLHSVALLIVLLAVQQALFGLNSPARASAIPRLVPVSQLAAANALNSTVLQTGALFGPLAAGALIPVIGLPSLYLIDTLGLAATLWAVLLLPALAPLDGAVRRADWSQVADGFRFAAGHRLLLMSFLVDILAMVFGMPRALFPQLAATTFASDHLALGLLYAAIPAGSLAAGLLSGTFTRARRPGRMTVAAVAVWGLAVAGFGLSGSLPVACAMLALGGAADLVSMVFRGAILQSAAPDEMRGRMQGVFVVVVTGGPRLADLLHGFAGAAFGTRAAIAGGGFAVAVLVVLLSMAAPSYARYRIDT